MEPRAGAPQALTPESTQADDSTWRFRVRLFAACVVLAGLALIQSPGLLVADTKLDLAIAPLDFLGRAAHLWDPEGTFGQLQNQAYGYLWPMGPFFVLGSLLDLPAWVVQRLWLALVMCLAFLGAAKVARALGVRSDLACIAAGFAYALSPRMLTTLGPISIEAWPSALAPWVLLPLVIGATRGSPRRAAALSAFAIAMIGGVNAAATAAVLPLGALWLITRTPGPRRRSMMLWWPAFTLMGTLWWLVPLFLMGAYSPPFLDFIESAANTTLPTNLFDALRGTSNWVPYVDSSSRAGNDLIREFHLVLNSGVLLVVGLVGMMLRRNPHRLFLVSGLLVGLFLVSMGHTGDVQGWFAQSMQELLDGPLAPLRNVHKFDLVVRLPMVLGLAWALQELVERTRVAADSGERINLRLLAGVVVFAVAAAALPAALGRITPAGAFRSIPDYWHEAAAWLGEEQEDGVALLVPGSSFANYAWGSPRDEPLQVLGEKPWAVRNAVPLTPPGTIRMLDAIESRIASGTGSAGLTSYLRRAGVSHLVIRNDLARSGDIVDPVLVHQALEGTTGINRVATFGPPVGGEAHLERNGRRVVINGGWQNEYPAIEVYEVSRGGAFARSTETAPVVVGGPEDLLDLSELGILDERPTVLAGDLVGKLDPAAPVVLTDGRRAVERHFGRLHDASSETLLRDQRLRLEATVRDYVLADAERWSTFAAYEGIAGLSASSSRSDPSASGGSDTGASPFAAIDGHPETAWESGRFSEAGHWWQVDLLEPIAPDQVVITAGPGEDQELVLRSPRWKSEVIEVGAGESATIPVEGDLPWLRVEDASGRTGTPLSLAEVQVPGVDATRSLVLPDLPAGADRPEAIVLRAAGRPRTGCATIDGAVRCVPGAARSSEESRGFHRTFGLPGAASYPASVTVRPLAGGALDELVLDDLLFGIRASSTANPDPRSSALAAVDGDAGTTWTAAPDDLLPTLSMNWLQKRAVTGLRLEVPDDTAARLPRSLLLRWPGGRRTVEVGDDGDVDFHRIRTKQLSVSVLDAETVTSIGFDGSGFEVPVGIGELTVEGLPFLPVSLSQERRRYRCGTGPTLNFNGLSLETSVTATPAELYAGLPVTAELCGTGSVPLVEGRNTVESDASAAFAPDAVVLGRLDLASGATALPSRTDGPVERALEVDDAPAVLGTRENVNTGWDPAASGGAVSPQVVDGWRVGWRVGPETEPGSSIRVEFAPDRAYRIGLGIGLVTLLLLVLHVVGPWRRRRPASHLEQLEERSLPGIVGVPLSILAGALLAGPVGGLAATASVVAVRLARRVVGGWTTPWIAMVLLPAAGAYVARPWADPAGWAGVLSWPSYLVVVASCGALAAAASVDSDSSPRQRRFSRMAGISTRR